VPKLPQFPTLAATNKKAPVATAATADNQVAAQQAVAVPTPAPKQIRAAYAAAPKKVSPLKEQNFDFFAKEAVASAPKPKEPSAAKKVVASAQSAGSKLVGPVRKSARRVANLTRKPNFFERAQMRKDKYSPLIIRQAKEQGVPVKLALAIVEIESSFRVKAKGAAGEVGLMQIRPRTARGMGYRGSTKALYDPETNVRYGMKYLAEAHRRGGGSTCGTILKYNAGHYAKRMNPISARYCRKVKKVMAKDVSL